MEISKSLRRPANWPDFESLCKKLWGEIWNCAEIKKNGRSGQAQHGVDIYGIPKGENQYYGIQCKGKDEYSHKQFSEEEIETEIELAKKFQPHLKKLYFTTTAVKDVKIEDIIRKKNLENISKKLFEIHIYSWEDIVDLIDENKRTHDWYVKSQKFFLNKSIAVSFSDNSNEITCSPKFRKTNINYIQKAVPLNPYHDPLNYFTSQREGMGRILFPEPTSVFKHTINFSYFPINFKILNTGTSPIEEFKLLFEIEGDLQDIRLTNENNEFPYIISSVPYVSNVDLISPKSGEVSPIRKRILVGDDSYISDDIFIKPFPKESQLIIKWKLISKDHKEEGKLIINVIPKTEINYQSILVADPFEVRNVAGEIEDFIEDVKKDDK